MVHRNTSSDPCPDCNGPKSQYATHCKACSAKHREEQRCRKKDPTPAEIEERCKEIQATWSEDEKIKRTSVSIRPLQTNFEKLHRVVVTNQELPLDQDYGIE